MTERFAFIAPGVEIVGPTPASVLERARQHPKALGCFLNLAAVQAEIDRDLDALAAILDARHVNRMATLKRLHDFIAGVESGGSDG